MSEAQNSLSLLFVFSSPFYTFMAALIQSDPSHDFSVYTGTNMKYYGLKKHFNLCTVQPFGTNCWPLVWIGVRTNVLSGPMERAVRRPAGVLTEGSAITWVEHACVKQASPASFVRHACVPKGSTASNVTNGAPATWTILIGECQLPREKHCLLKL